MKKAFYAFSSVSTEVVDQISRAASDESLKPSGLSLETWLDNDVSGRLLIGPILEKINVADLVVADVSHQNHNVYFEIGYAIGKGKDIAFTRSVSHATDPDDLRKVGLFDSTGYTPYNNSTVLVDQLKNLAKREEKIFTPTTEEKNTSQPCYVLLPHDQQEVEVHVWNRLKQKSKIHCRKFDPNESARFSIQDAIDEVASSYGIVLIFNNRSGFENLLHNLRCAFVAGLAEGFGIRTLILNHEDQNLALDYRHRGFTYRVASQVDKPVTDFSIDLFEAIQLRSNSGLKPLAGALAKLNLGASQAENEEVELANYYHRTELFERLLRNELSVVAGRKGTGKSAMFIQAGSRLSRDKRNVVVSLQPEGYQLRKLKEALLIRLEPGSRDHLVAAFWEYILFIEIASAICSNEVGRFHNDPDLKNLYEQLQFFCGKDHCEAGDFVERMLQVIERLVDAFSTSEKTMLTRADIVNVIYKSDFVQLKELIGSYMKSGRAVRLLVDNLDKGWYSVGVDSLDILMLSSLLEAAQRVKRDLRRYGDVGSVIFVRNDVFEIASEHNADKGKIPKEVIDWSDDDVLRSIIRNRIKYFSNIENPHASFADVWGKICISHFSSKDGVESSSYFIERSLKRPRALLDFIQTVKSYAVNSEKDKIDDTDLDAGELKYSTKLVEDINDEMSDIYGIRRDFLYSFIECDGMLSKDEAITLIKISGVAEPQVDRYFEILVWYGFFGIYFHEEEKYIYDLSYSMRKFKGLMKKDNTYFKVNPAFHRALEIKM